jgi:hypothetical protein
MGLSGQPPSLPELPNQLEVLNILLKPSKNQKMVLMIFPGFQAHEGSHRLLPRQLPTLGCCLDSPSSCGFG